MEKREIALFLAMFSALFRSSSFFSLSFCIVGLFINTWGKGDSIQTQLQDTLVSRDFLKQFEYKHFTEIGIFRSCYYKSCISNPVDGVNIWKIIVGIGSLSLGSLTTSTIMAGFQVCSEAKWLIYGQLGVHLLGVILYTATIVLFSWETAGITLGLGFYFALFADIFALCTWIGGFSNVICTRNKVEPSAVLQT